MKQLPWNCWQLNYCTDTSNVLAWASFGSKCTQNLSTDYRMVVLFSINIFLKLFAHTIWCVNKIVKYKTYSSKFSSLIQDGNLPAKLLYDTLRSLELFVAERVPFNLLFPRNLSTVETRHASICIVYVMRYDAVMQRWYLTRKGASSNWKESLESVPRYCWSSSPLKTAEK